MHDYDAVTRRAVFRNVDTRPRTSHGASALSNSTTPGSTSLHSVPSTTSSMSSGGTPAVEKGNSKVVQKASSMSIDFEATSAPFHLINLTGR